MLVQFGMLVDCRNKKYSLPGRLSRRFGCRYESGSPCGGQGWTDGRISRLIEIQGHKRGLEGGRPGWRYCFGIRISTTVTCVVQSEGG